MKSGIEQAPAHYAALDLVKLICALLVVVIHTSPLESVSAAAQFAVENILARVAVPLFFAISGFLFFGKLKFNGGKISADSENFRRLLTCCKKNILLYLGWSAVYLVLVYLPMWYRTGWWGIHVVKDTLASLLFSGIHYHLWYLLAMIYAVPLLYGLLCLLPIKKVSWIAVLLWAGECLTYSYAWIGVDRLPLVSFISSRMPIVFDATFRAVPLLMAGAAIARTPPDWNRKKTYLICTAAFLLCTAEATALYILSPNEGKYSYLFSTPMLAASWLFCILQVRKTLVPKAGAQMMRQMSLTIYCIHPLVIEAANACGIPRGMPRWLVVTTVSAAISAIYAWLRMQNCKNRRLKR